MNPITCHVCGSRKITYYRQIRKDRVAVVTARCENDHSPVKGKPFFPTYLFDVWKLPLLPSQAQLELPQPKPKLVMTPVATVPKFPKPKQAQPARWTKNFPLPVEEK